jgi:hypothetical protein
MVGDELGELLQRSGDNTIEGSEFGRGPGATSPGEFQQQSRGKALAEPTAA